MNKNYEILWQDNIPTTKEATREAIRKTPGSPKSYLAVLEPISVSQWYTAFLTQEGITVVHSDPGGNRKIAEEDFKRDKKDSETLAFLLASGCLKPSYQAPEQIWELREVVRYRAHLVKKRTDIKNRMHSWFHKEGVDTPASDIFSKAGKKWVAQKAESLHFGNYLLSALRIVDVFDQEIEDLEKILQRFDETYKEELKILTSIKGIGRLTAYILLSELGDYARFPTPNCLTSYVGLAPRSDSSADKEKFGSITKKGSPIIRHALVEAAQRVNPKWGDLYKFYKRVSYKKGSKVARVALARKVLCISWHCMRKRTRFHASAVGAHGGVKSEPRL